MIEILTKDLITDVTGTAKNEVLEELCSLTSSAAQVRDHHALLTAIMNRERIMSTGIGMGIAVPHARTSAVTNMIMAIGRSREGIDFEALDNEPAHIIVLIGGPDRRRDEFLRLIAQVGSLFYESDFKDRLMEADSPVEMLGVIQEHCQTIF